MKKRLLLLFLFLFALQQLFCQIQTDMIKYWFYRNRLNNYFVIPGEKKGESQIICVRNHIKFYNDPTDEQNNYAAKNVDYGQQGKYTGFYWGVLATEYYLLKQNGQNDDAAKTANELYLALGAYENYLDDCEYFWGFNNSTDGFFIRNNVPCDFLSEYSDLDNAVTITGERHLDLLNKGLTPENVFNSQTNTFNNLPLGHPGYADHRTSQDCNGYAVTPNTPFHYHEGICQGHPEAMSQDEAIFIMMGMALAIKLTDNDYYPCYDRAISLYNLLVRYIINLDDIWGWKKWRIYEPSPDHNVQIPADAGGNTYTFGKGIIEAGKKMTGWDYGHADPFQCMIWNDIGQSEVFNPSINFDLVCVLAAIGESWNDMFGGITINSIGFDAFTFYNLLYEVLHNSTYSDNTQQSILYYSLLQMDNAPCEGPYCYKSDYERDEHGDPYYVGNGIKSGEGWASTYKWCQEIWKQNGGDPSWCANFSGTDYMLLYNLYQIMNNENCPYYVNYIDRKVSGNAPVLLQNGIEFGTNDNPVNFVAFNSITSSQVISTQTTPVVSTDPGNITYTAETSIHLIPGFHAEEGTYFHAQIKDIDCSGSEVSKDLIISEYPDNMYTPYFDSLISLPKKPYECTVDDDTNAINNLVTLECPVDTIEFMGINGDTIGDTYTYYWDFGNGQISTWKAPKVFYEPGTYNFSLILTDSSGISDTMNVIVEVPYCPDTSGGQKVSQIQNIFTANNSITNSKVFVFHNPNDNTFQLSCEISENADGTFEIYDLTGRKLLSYSVLSGKNIISIQAFPVPD